MSDELPLRGLTGYCIDLLTRLADKDHMDFDFEIVPATNVRFLFPNLIYIFIRSTLKMNLILFRINMDIRRKMDLGLDWLVI